MVKFGVGDSPITELLTQWVEFKLRIWEELFGRGSRHNDMAKFQVKEKKACNFPRGVHWYMIHKVLSYSASIHALKFPTSDPFPDAMHYSVTWTSH